MLAVYRGETPDQVPLFLDLSHWFYQKHGIPFDLSQALVEPDHELIAYHKRRGVGFCIPNLVSYYDVEFPLDVVSTTVKEETPDGIEITWRYETPHGTIERKRRWEQESYSWSVSRWGVRSAEDLRVLGYALGSCRFTPAFERYPPWLDALGDLGIPYMPMGYSAMGYLLSYWMGIENTVYACFDMPRLMHEVVDQINENMLRSVEMLCASQAEVVFLGDNFSSDIQPPHFFKEWSEPYYRRAFERIRASGKHSAVHVDGRLKGLLAAFAGAGASCIDAVTPKPLGDLWPDECRDEAGPGLILSGGVPPNLWLPQSSDEEFAASVHRWLELRKRSPRLIASAGDQVPPGAVEHRIELMRDLVDARGRY